MKSQPKIRISLHLALAIVLSEIGGIQLCNAETWTNLRGTSTIEADMVGLWSDRLILDTSDGRRIAVALDDLRAESRIQAMKLASSKDESRQARVAELKLQSDIAAAPAPNPLPGTPPTSDYAAPDKTQEIEKLFKSVDEQVRAGHALAIFDALPESYQKEIDELSKIAAAKVNAATWNTTINSIRQIGDLIVTKQNWFFSHPRFDVAKSTTPESTERLNETILSLANLVRSGLNADDFEPARIQSMPLRDWLIERDELIAPHLSSILRRSGGSPPNFAVEKGKGKEVSLQIEMLSPESDEPVTKKISMTKVDETYVPKPIADLWKTLIPQTKKALEEAAEDSLLSDPTTIVLLSAIEPLLRPMQDAQNRNDFHAAMQPVIEAIGPMLPELQERFGTGF